MQKTASVVCAENLRWHFDPDIPSEPYCRKCLDKIKKRNFIKNFGT